MRVVVSGVPRGYQTPRPDGNWLQEEHRRRIEALSPDIELVEMPRARCISGLLEEKEPVLDPSGDM